MPSPHPEDLRNLLWGRGTNFNADTGERYHASDRSHMTPNAMTTHEISIVMSKKTKREIRLKRAMKDPDELSKPKAGPSVIYNLPSGATSERESRLRHSMKDAYKEKEQESDPSVINHLSSIATDEEEDETPPRIHPYTDKMDNT